MAEFVFQELKNYDTRKKINNLEIMKSLFKRAICRSIELIINLLLIMAHNDNLDSPGTAISVSIIELCP